MNQNDLNYSGQYLDDKYFKIKIATGGDIYNAAESAVAGEMFLVTGNQPALYAAKSTSTFSDGIADHDIYKVKDLTNVPKIKNVSLMQFPGTTQSNGYSMSFDGVDDFLETSVPEASTWSFSLWFKPSFDDDSLKQYTLLGSSSSGGGWVRLIYTGTNHSGPYIDYAFKQAAYPQSIIQQRYTIASLETDFDEDPLNDWNHLVYTYNSFKQILKIYLNGQKIGEDSDAINGAHVAPFSPTLIGAAPGNTENFKGNIDELGWWDGTVLSASQITSIYNDGLNGDLLAYSPSNLWRMGNDDSVSGTTISDVAGSNNATIDGATISLNKEQHSTYSLELDGSTSASLASDISFTGPFTISAWVKPDQTSLGMPFGEYSASNFVLRYANSAFAFWVNGTDYVNGSSNFPNGSWYHVMVVRDSSDLITMYVNGASDASFTHSGTLTTTGLVSSTYKYIGLSDEYAVWDSDQSANIAEIYNGGIPGNLDSLAPLGWWRMGDDDSGRGTTITDQGSAANNATIVGNAIYSQETPE